MTGEMAFEIALDLDFDQAVESVTAHLKTEGFGVLTKIDVKATLKEKIGEEFRPYIIMGACNPKLAHRALSSNAEVGLLLPCNITVETIEEGKSIVRVINPVAMMSFGDLQNDPILNEVAFEARDKLEKVASALSNI